MTSCTWGRVSCFMYQRVFSDTLNTAHKSYPHTHTHNTPWLTIHGNAHMGILNMAIQPVRLVLHIFHHMLDNNNIYRWCCMEFCECAWLNWWHFRGLGEMARSTATAEQLKQPTTEIKNKKIYGIKLNEANLQIKNFFPVSTQVIRRKIKRQRKTARQLRDCPR